MTKFKLKIEWKTNEYYDIDALTLQLTEVKMAAIRKARAILKENPDFDSIRVMIDEKCITAESDLHRLGYGFVLVRSGDGLYFVGTDHYDSANQVETESFELEDNISMKEIEDFIDEWGQTHDEICAELGYDDDGANEMIIGDGYIWFERYQKWFPKSTSLYDQNDEKILNYLKLNYC